jgi:hypothetical protein
MSSSGSGAVVVGAGGGESSAKDVGAAPTAAQNARSSAHAAA